MLVSFVSLLPVCRDSFISRDCVLTNRHTRCVLGFPISGTNSLHSASFDRPSRSCQSTKQFQLNVHAADGGDGKGTPPNNAHKRLGDEGEWHWTYSHALFTSSDPRSKVRYKLSERASPNLSKDFTRFLKEIRMCQALLAINIAVFLVQVLGGSAVLMAGAKVNGAIAGGQYYRLFSPMFLHASLTHLAVNSFSLNSTGPSVESWFGRQRFMFLYLVSGVCGNMLSFLCTPTPSVGASGAIFGLVGASAVILGRHRELLGPRARKGLQSLVYIVIMNFGMGLSPGSRIDNFGHLGGFLGGIAYSYLFGPRLVARRLRSGRTIIRDEPILSLVIRDIRSRIHFVRRLLQRD